MFRKMKVKNSLIITLVVIVALISVSILAVSIATTNPTKLGPGGVTFWFINLLVLLSSLLSLLIYSLQYKKSDQKRKLLFSSIRTGCLMGFAFTLLLALSSLRSLSWRDIILLVLLVILVELLFRTRRKT